MKLKIKRPYSYEMGQLAPVEQKRGKYTRYHLAHSAKGSTWEEHKYVKVVDGVYYYPDNYEGGRHISDINGSSKDNKNSSGDLNSDFYKEWERSLGNIKLDPKSVQQLLMFGKDKDGKDYDNFKAALSKSGVDISKMSDDQINEMRYKVVDHYKEEFSKEKENFDSEGNRIKDREEKKESMKSSSKKSSKSSKNKSEDETEEKSEKKTEEKKADDEEEEEKRKKRNSRYAGGYNGKNAPVKLLHSETWSSSEALRHHGILGMKWGKKNGPPYPLGPGDHSAAEEAAMKKRRGGFDTADTSKKSTAKQRHKMTDEELLERLGRLKKEKEVKDLEKQIGDENEGRDYVKSILKDAGKKVLTTAIAGGVLYAGKAFISKEFNRKEFGDAIFYGGAKKKSGKG